VKSAGHDDAGGAGMRGLVALPTPHCSAPAFGDLVPDQHPRAAKSCRQCYATAVLVVSA
jgi:hypothetical protein